MNNYHSIKLKNIVVLNMNEKKPRKKRIRGFAGVIESQLKPKGESDKFKHIFRNVNKKICVNAIDGRYAALVIINNGIIEVEEVKNKPKSNLSKKSLDWDGRIMMSAQSFLEIAMGKLSMTDIVLRMFSRKIKIRGVKNVLLLLKVFKLKEESNDK